MLDGDGEGYVRELARQLVIRHPGLGVSRAFSLAEQFYRTSADRADRALRERATMPPPAQPEDGPPLHGEVRRDLGGRILGITET